MAKWTPKHEAPEPLEGPVVATITGGTIVWFVLFLVQLPFYDWYADHGHTWWLWTCLAGGGLGLIGIWYVRKRDAALKRAAAAAQESTGKTEHSEKSEQGENTGHTRHTRHTEHIERTERTKRTENTAQTPGPAVTEKP